uniref:Uncharacterized protein n=1 Tax=viral metagenome TaxID=1070528 RepID=A0A6C0I9Y5_9ZZZZ
MTTNADYHQIEADIADISRTIAKQQQYVYDLTAQRINTAYQYDAYVKGQQHNLRRFIKQKNELENKLQRIHEERYRELEKSNTLDGVSDVLSLAFQYAHPIDKTTNKYAVEKRIIKNARSHSPIHRNNDNDREVVRVYKKDRFELFLDFLTTNLKILRFLCVIAFVILYIIYAVAYIYTKIFG